MGNRLGKNKASSEKSKDNKTGLSKPFPVLTPQAYLPGSAMASGGSIYPPGYNPPTGINQNIGFNTGGPPIGNTGYNPLSPPPPPPPPYNSMLPPRPAPRPISYSNMNQMSMGAHSAPLYDPSASYGRPIRSSRRHRSRYCRPIVHIIESDSCSTISTCSSDSCCSLPRCSTIQQQQPIILLPIQCLPTQSQSMILQPLNPVPQQIRAGPIHYVQSAPQQPILTNTSTYHQSTIIKPISQ